MRAVFSPLARPARHTAVTVSIIILIWIAIGGIHYHSQYKLHRALFEEQHDVRTQIEERRSRVQQKLQEHPTSRDLLIESANLSHQLGDYDAFEMYLERLRKIDPNHPVVQELGSYRR